ncbi:MAG: secretin N-terminal domain-containing protein, partial [Planctomycetota bacterium]
MQESFSSRRTLRAALPVVLVASLVASLASRSLAQSVEEEDNNYLIQFDEIDGTPLDDFLSLCEELTGLQLNYSTVDTKDVRLRFVGRKTLPKEQFWAYFQAVLKAYDFVVVPYGNIGAPGRPKEGPETGFFAIRKSTGGVAGAKPGYIKSMAPVVTAEQLESYKYDPGIVLTTSFTLRYINVQEAANMLQTYFTDPMLESIRAVSNSNSLVATGFAQTLYGISGLLKLIDTKPDEYTPRFAKIELEHAVAEEIQPIVTELIDAERGVATRAGGGAGRGVPAGGASTLPASLQEPDPQVSVDPRTNSLLIIAASGSLDKIVNYIRLLDIEVDPRGDTHVYRLKNSAAKELEEILTEWAQNSGAGSGGGGAQAGGAGGAGARGGTLEQPTTVVADESSNSLVITASKSRYAQILEIVK